MSEQQPAACDDDPDVTWVRHTGAALARTVPEPLLAVWPFLQTGTIGDAGGLIRQVVLMITPTSVYAYPRWRDGEIDIRCELAAWSRRSLSVTVGRDARHVTLGLVTPDGERVEFHALRHTRLDAFVRLIEHPVGL